MLEPLENTCWFFADESGDATFYDRRGHLIVGREGCSPILVLGFIQTTDPIAIRRRIQALHKEMVEDPYLQAIPSIAKTQKAFHAKDDSPEVRHLVFNAILKMAFEAQFVVARKIESIFRSRFHGNELRFYDELVSRLFAEALHQHPHNLIYFAQRGSRKRQAPLQAAIQKGVERFDAQHTQPRSDYAVFSQTPPSEMCLQVIDYLNWAVYRAFVQHEMRYFRLIASKVSRLVDLYDVARYPYNSYNRNNLFDIEKASPL